jgi:hypothetical protein
LVASRGKGVRKPGFDENQQKTRAVKIAPFSPYNLTVRIALTSRKRERELGAASLRGDFLYLRRGVSVSRVLLYSVKLTKNAEDELKKCKK